MRGFVVEILGPTSSGKSTFARELLACDAKNCADNEVRFRLAEPEIRSLTKLIGIDIIALFYFVLAKKPLSITIQLLGVSLKRNDTLFMRLNLFRNYLKKQGQVEYFRKRNSSEIIILDEGSIHAYSNLFNHYDCKIDKRRLRACRANISVPDAIVMVNAKCKEMVYRAQNRVDSPWPELSAQQWRNIFRNSNDAYEIILTPTLKIPVVHINSDNYDPSAVRLQLLKLCKTREERAQSV